VEPPTLKLLAGVKAISAKQGNMSLQSNGNSHEISAARCGVTLRSDEHGGSNVAGAMDGKEAALAQCCMYFFLLILIFCGLDFFTLVWGLYLYMQGGGFATTPLRSPAL